MDRRTMLRRIGAAAAGTGLLAGTGSAETRTVEIDGETYLTWDHVSDAQLRNVDASSTCECPDCDPSICLVCDCDDTQLQS